MHTPNRYVPPPFFPSGPEYYKMSEDGITKTAITRTEYKKYMRENFTVRHRTLPLCGHKFALEREPKFRNCESCWFAFFQVHGELTQSVDEVFSKFGESGVRQLRGPKFTENYLKFMSTLALWKKQNEAPSASIEETPNVA